MPYLSCTVTHIFSVDYWRKIEIWVTGRSRSLKFVPLESFGMVSHYIATTALSCIIWEIKLCCVAHVTLVVFLSQ